MAVPQVQAVEVHIDLVVMRQRDRRMCMDVAVQRRAVCNTNHNLVCARCVWSKVVTSPRGGRFDVEKLASCPRRVSGASDGAESKRGLALTRGGGMEEKWKAVYKLRTYKHSSIGLTWGGTTLPARLVSRLFWGIKASPEAQKCDLLQVVGDWETGGPQ